MPEGYSKGLLDFLYTGLMVWTMLLCAYMAYTAGMILLATAQVEPNILTCLSDAAALGLLAAATGLWVYVIRRP